MLIQNGHSFLRSSDAFAPVPRCACDRPTYSREPVCRLGRTGRAGPGARLVRNRRRHPTARTDTVARADITADVSASGSLSAVGTQNLGFATSGRLTSVRVHVGDRVKAGQVLAKIDATAAKAALGQAKGNLHAQQAGLDRLTSSTTVAGSQSTVSQANAIVDATSSQAAATADADDAAIGRAKAQLAVDEDAKDQASSALKAVKRACRAASSSGSSAGAAVGTLAQQALQQLQSGDSAGAAQTLAQLNSQLGSAPPRAMRPPAARC